MFCLLLLAGTQRSVFLVDADDGGFAPGAGAFGTDGADAVADVVVVAADAADADAVADASPRAADTRGVPKRLAEGVRPDGAARAVIAVAGGGSAGIGAWKGRRRALGPAAPQQ